MTDRARDEAPWYQGFLFDDPSFVFEFLRVASKAVEHGSDLGECLETARRIRHRGGGPPAMRGSWHEEWRQLAERIERIGEDCLARGHPVSARDAFLRAAEYFRSADFYLHDDPSNRAIRELGRKVQACFGKVRELSVPGFEEVRIPFAGAWLPGYFCPAAPGAGPAPTVVAHQGFDGTNEETYTQYARDAHRRGYNLLAFEGPGQGRVIREQGIPFRPDWEAVVTPVVDWLLGRPEVDPARIALLGLSMGGYLAPRAAAHEHRLAACIANSGVFDVFEQQAAGAGMGRDALLRMLREDPLAYDRMARAAGEASVQAYWGVTHGMWAFGCSAPHETALRMADYHLRDCVASIRCPMLVIGSAGEQFFGGQATRLLDALTCPKTWLEFQAGEGAELHCQVGGALLGNQRIFDWLDETI